MENHTITKEDNIMELNYNVSRADRKRLVKTIQSTHFVDSFCDWA